MQGHDAETSCRAHWDDVYQSRAEAQLSWHQDEPATSLALIRDLAGSRESAIDVGGGSSALAGQLVALGFARVAVLDIAAAAIERAQIRNGTASTRIHWIMADITQPCAFEPVSLWHDRAVFHFLTNAAQRARYVANVCNALRPGGHAIIATFAPDGPEQCSGLPVMRYDAESLARELGPTFALVQTQRESHVTPWGRTQQFMYAVLRRAATIGPAHDADHIQSSAAHIAR